MTLRHFWLLLCGMWLFTVPALAQVSTTAKQAVIFDYDTWQLLYAKNLDAQMAPSSMTKIMTAYVVFDALKAERNGLTLETRLKVSDRAYDPIGSRMWLGLDTTVSVDKLLNGLIVQSGNDAAVVLAEGIGGSVEGFVQMMNETAARLGMTNTSFKNPSGLNEEGHYSTAHDIAVLSRALIANHADFYTYFGQKAYTYADIRQENRNLLIGGPLGVDGIKTGYTSAGGYGQATSAVDPGTGRRVIVVFNGTDSKAARKREAEKLVDFALSNFSNHMLFRDGQIVGYAPVWLGERGRIPLVVKRDVERTLRRDAINNMQGTLLIFKSPIPAPISEGQPLGKLLYFSLGMNGETAPFEEMVYAGEPVESLGRVDAALQGVRYYLFD